MSQVGPDRPLHRNTNLGERWQHLESLDFTSKVSKLAAIPGGNLSIQIATNGAVFERTFEINSAPPPGDQPKTDKPPPATDTPTGNNPTNSGGGQTSASLLMAILLARVRRYTLFFFPIFNDKLPN